MNKRRESTTNIFSQIVTISILLAISSLLVACGPTIEAQSRGNDQTMLADAPLGQLALKR